MQHIRCVTGVLLAFMALVNVSEGAKLPGNSNGCSGAAHEDPTTGVWYVICSGSTCGSGGTLPCAVLSGGVPGANFTFCGCSDGNPQTPTCCYVAVPTTGDPFGNGLCKDMGAPAGSSCPRGNDCNTGLNANGDRIGKCEGVEPVHH